MIGECLDGLAQIDESITVASDEPTPEGNEIAQVEAVQRAPHGVRRSGELQAHKRSARLQHAEHLRKRLLALGHIANAIRHGDDVVAFAGVGDILRVDHLEVHGDARRRALRVMLARHIQHLGDQVGALDVRRLLRARHGEGDVPRAARDIQHVMMRLNGGLLGHARQPQLVGAEARDRVEALILLGNGRENALYALARQFSRSLLPRSGVNLVFGNSLHARPFKTPKTPTKEYHVKQRPVGSTLLFV